MQHQRSSLSPFLSFLDGSPDVRLAWEGWDGGRGRRFQGHIRSVLGHAIGKSDSEIYVGKWALILGRSREVREEIP
jgi:hypothetical protein